MEQFYPSFTLCPEYHIGKGIKNKDIEHSLETFYNKNKNYVFNELNFLTHVVKSEDG